MSHSFAIHPSYSYYRVNTIRILVEVSYATVDNDSVKSAPGTFVYPFTTFIGFRRIKPSSFSLILKTHLTCAVFLPLSSMVLIFVVIQAFLDRNCSLLVSQTFSIIFVWPFHCFLEGLMFCIIRINRRTVLPLYFSSSCYTIFINLVSLVTF